ANPAFPPYLPWSCLALFDPRLGPRLPEEECLHNGGDGGRRPGLDNQGRLQGLKPSATVAQYKDEHDRSRLAISNQICLCVPRFAIARVETPLSAHENVYGTAGAAALHGQFLLQGEVPSLLAEKRKGLVKLKGRERPTIALAIEGLDRLTTIEMLNATHVYE